ncbi:MAG TPA: ABC transporter substrate-binding protein [Candidatus Atribacteria bacterium]|nr:ABC transporter substrate-binding protein [Candidatus Atribacteria bacterium]
MKKLFVVFLFVIFVSITVNAATDIEITFWTHEDPNRTEIENRYIAEFEQANPGVTIKRVTSGSGQIQELILTAFAANQGPDIFNMSIEDEYAYIVNERLAPVDFEAAGYPSLQAIYDAYIPGVLDPVTYKGQLYGLPLELTNWCIYINKKIFRDVGLDPEKDYPKTWEEMMEVSDKIAIREGEILKRRGFDFRYPYYLVSWVPMVEQLGGKLISDDGKTAIINEEAWLKVLDYMREWGPNGRNLGSPTYTNARKLFNKDNNDVAMCLTGLYQQGRIRADNPEFYESGEWMVVPFPVFENAVKDVPAAYYGHYYMVNGQKPKENQQIAWKFIAFMLSHPEEYLTKVNIVQPTVKLMESATFKSMPYSEVFKNDMAKGHIVYYGESSAKIQSLIREAVESVMLAGVSPEDALKTLKRKVQEVLEEG